MLLSQVTLISEELVKLIAELQTLHIQTCWWSFAASLEVNDLLHKSHLYWKFPVYIHLSLQVTLFWEWSVKNFTGKGSISSMYMLMFLQSPWSVNDLLHTSHSPVCRHWLPCSVNDYTLTYSMEQSSSSEAAWFAASQEIPHIVWNSNVHYHIHKCPPPVPVLSQLNPLHTPTSHFLKIHLKHRNQLPKSACSSVHVCTCAVHIDTVSTPV
jgi:hypothetical protein